MSMRIDIVDRARGAELAADRIRAIVAANPRAVIGFATGASPTPLYGALQRRRADFTRVTGFALDEYVGLPAGHPASYREVLDRQVRGPLGIARRRMRAPDVGASDLDAASARYERAIAEAGGIDVQILGIGVNGHLGFNEPGTSFDSRTRVAELAASTREANARHFANPDDVPRSCITQGLATIGEARHVILIAAGRTKAAAVQRALEGPVSEACPASMLRRHPSVHLIADPAAAALLTSTTKESAHVQ